jgi:predicted ATP-dependent endonuclease of OLD family
VRISEMNGKISIEKMHYGKKKQTKDEYPELFRHVSESCRILNRKMIKIDNIIKDLKDNSKNKWINRYEKIASDFFNENYEQANKKQEMQ